MAEPDRNVVLVINPLEATLAHYEGELLETLNSLGQDVVEIGETVAGDGITGPRERIVIAAKTLWQRGRMTRFVRGQTIIVIWPLFGYLDPVTWIGLARYNTIYIIVHDPSPLRRTYGQSLCARRLFKRAVNRVGIRVIYHTLQAQRIGHDKNGVSGAVAPHPIGMKRSLTHMHGVRDTLPVVRVLGQYKQTRSLAALAVIADRAAGSCVLEIHGRGWPRVPGWTVVDQFVPEDEFSALVETSDCIVIPYDSFFQSGVAVRCLEAGVPVVAPRHEHIAQLYGDDWAGTVRDVADWYEALIRALRVDRAEIRSRHLRVAREIRNAWQLLLLADRPSSS